MPDPWTDLRAALDQPALVEAALAALPPAARGVLAAEEVGAARLVDHAVEALLVDARLARAGARVEHPTDGSDPVERLLLSLPARARTRARALADALVETVSGGTAELDASDPFPRSFPARAVKRRGAVDTEAALVDLVLDLARWDGLGSRSLLEPAVGRGAFLARAWSRALDAGVPPADAARDLVGVDVHPFACRAARVRLALVAAERGLVDDPRLRPAVHLGDALDDDPRWPAGRFDLVVGNPPYVRGERLPAAARARLRARWPDLGAGNVDLAAYFVRRALDWCSSRGRLAFVLTQGVCDARAAEGLRARLGAATLEALVGFEWAPPQFSDASVIPCVLVARRAPAPRDHVVAVSAARAAAPGEAALALTTSRVPQRDWIALGRGRWSVEVRDDDLPLLRALDLAPRPLVAGYGLAIRTRVGAGALIADAGSPEAARFTCPRPLLDGREVRAFSIDWGGRVIDYRPDLISDPKSEAFFAAPKVIMARIALSTQAAVDDEPGGPYFARNTVMVVRAPGTALDDEPHALCAVINSLPLRAYAFLVLRAGALAGSHRATFYSGVIGDLPVPASLVHDRGRAADLAALARRARDLAHTPGTPDAEAARRRVQDAIDDAVADAYGLSRAVLDHLRGRAASTPLAQVLRAPRAGAALRRIALREWTAGARYR